MTPQLAVRVAMVGTFALAMFAIIFFRLWFLQVLTGDQYALAAQGNYTRHVAVAAPRGEILAQDGTVLVNSTPVNSVRLLPANLPVPVVQVPTRCRRSRPRTSRCMRSSRRSCRSRRRRSRARSASRRRRASTTSPADWRRSSVWSPSRSSQQPFAERRSRRRVDRRGQHYLQERENEFPGVSARRI